MKKLFVAVLVLAALLPSCGKAAPAAVNTITETTTDAVTELTAPEYLALPESQSLPASADATGAAVLTIMQTSDATQSTAMAIAPITVVSATGTSAAAKTAANLTTKPVTTRAVTTTRYVYNNNQLTAKTTAKATTSSSTTTTSNSTSAATITIRQTQAAISFTVDGSAAVPYGYDVSLPARAMTLNGGETVFDLLNRCGMAVQSRSGGMTAYVIAIGGLAEKDCGGTSGWVYEVNGVRPNMSCGRYQPQNGDAIVWRYSLTP